MLIIQLDQTSLFPCSILLGILLGFAYAAIKMIRCLFNHNNIILFVEDALFWLFASLSFIIFHYNCTFGIIRLYSFVGALSGFVLCYMMLGKLSERAAMKLKKFLMPFFLMIKGHFLKFTTVVSHYIKSKITIHRAKKGFV